MLRVLQTCVLSSSRIPLVSFFKSQFGIHGRSSCPVSEILQDHMNLPSTRNPFAIIRTYCTAEDLTSKKCVPCDSKDLRPMTEEAANELIQKVPGWIIVKEGDTLKLNRSWKVKRFTKGLELFQLIAEIAEAEGHHPDLHLVGWNNVKIEIWTHSVGRKLFAFFDASVLNPGAKGGLTENDFILASKISALDMHHLLRKAAN